jgi:hypothetical protein
MQPTPPAAQRFCSRDGCERYISRQRKEATCCNMCRLVSDMVEQAQRICETTHDTHHWLTAVQLNDALTQHQRSDARMYHAAMDVGLSRDQWQKIKQGSQKKYSETSCASTSLGDTVISLAPQGDTPCPGSDDRDVMRVVLRVQP